MGTYVFKPTILKVSLLSWCLFLKTYFHLSPLLFGIYAYNCWRHEWILQRIGYPSLTSIRKTAHSWLAADDRS